MSVCTKYIPNFFDHENLKYLQQKCFKKRNSKTEKAFSLKATQCIEPKNLWLPEKHQRFPQLLSQSKPDQALNYRQQPWQKWEANEAAGSLNKQTKTYQDFPFDGGGVGDAKKDDGKKNVPN